MHILRAFIIAFSIYSRLPVPQLEWREEDMKYMLCFFPMVGAIIGVCVYFWKKLCLRLGAGEIFCVLIGTVIPVIITGGFHIDGFMDTMDAFHSYAPREKKLGILKDSHIGAFAAIMLMLYGLIYIGCFSELSDYRILGIFCSGFFLSRCLSGISVVSFPAAKKEGSLCLFADKAQKNTVRATLYFQLAVCTAFMLVLSIYAVFVIGAAFLAFAYYYYRAKNELGGITGDTAGYFVLICEGAMVAAAALTNIFAG